MALADHAARAAGFSLFGRFQHGEQEVPSASLHGRQRRIHRRRARRCQTGETFTMAISRMLAAWAALISALQSGGLHAAARSANLVAVFARTICAPSGARRAAAYFLPASQHRSLLDVAPLRPKRLKNGGGRD